jgi:hypothetical protein
MPPLVAPSPAHLGTVTGLANQAITAGNLLGPPLALGVFAASGALGTTAVRVAALALGFWMVLTGRPAAGSDTR